MGWKKYLLGLKLSLALGVVVTLPAGAAKITTFTDSRGVTHISNAAQDRPQSDELPEILIPELEPKDKNDKLRLLYERRQNLSPELWERKGSN